jgi:hypothetical protein
MFNLMLATYSWNMQLVLHTDKGSSGSDLASFLFSLYMRIILLTLCGELLFKVFKFRNARFKIFEKFLPVTLQTPRV